MKLLFLGCLTQNKAGNSFGGAEKSLINLSNWCAHSGFDVTLASVEGDVKAYPVDKDVRFLGYPIKPNSSKMSTHLQMRRNTLDAIKKVNPDVVIGFWVHPLYYGGFLLKQKNIPYIYSLRNDPSREYSRITKFFMKKVVKKSSYIVFQTAEAQDYFGDLGKGKSSVIHNPTYIKPGQYEKVSEPDNRIVTVGRLNEQKNHKLLISAFHKLVCSNAKYSNIKLEIYGEGPLRGELESLIKELKLNNKVSLPGAYPEVLDRINGARLFVLPSLYEGMPNALIEAMCLGIPVISSDCPCGGPRELITDGVNGYLFKNNDLDDLVAKMRVVLDDADQTSLIQHEQEIMDTHSENRIFGEWKRIINRLCG